MPRATFRLMVTASMLGMAAPALAAWQTPGVPTAQMDAPAPGITATISAPQPQDYFTITGMDVAKAVAQQIEVQGLEKKADVQVMGGNSAIIYSANHPITLVIHSLQIDPQSRRWQGQAYLLAGGKTESVKPIGGNFTALVEVPTLTRQLSRGDVIEASDIAMKAVPDRLVRKDTVTDPNKLVGLSPRSMVSANRPLRMNEVASPVVVKRGDAVQMTYTNKYMSIKTTGVALQDGSVGDLIRVKNEKSEKAVSGRVESAGHVEMNNQSAL